MKLNRNFLGSILLWWIVLSFVYIVFNIFGFPLGSSELRIDILSNPADGLYTQNDYEEISFSTFVSRHPVKAFLTVTASFLGLFVPYGLPSLMLFLSISAWYSVLVFVPMIAIADYKIQRSTLPLSDKILLILVCLLVLTLIVDLVRSGSWISWDILLHGAQEWG